MNTAQRIEKTDSGFTKESLTPPFNGEKILIVDDNPLNRMVAQVMMKHWNLSIDFAYNGKEAVAKALTGKYRLILMDIQMPEMNGYEAARAIRQSYDKLSLPIIALTASIDLSSNHEVLASGMNDFVAKPFVPAEFHAHLKRFLDHP